MAGFLFGDSRGAFISILFFIFIILFLLLFGDKFFLASSFARALSKGDPFSEKVKNLSFRMSLPEVDVFVSKHLPANIYCLKSIFSKPRILITKEIKESFDKGQVDDLLLEALLKIKNGLATKNLFYAFLFSLISFPQNLLVRWKYTYYIALSLGYFLTPVDMLKKFIIKSGRSEDVYSLKGSQNSVKASNFFKIESGYSMIPRFILEMAFAIGVVDSFDRSLYPSLLGSYSKSHHEILKSKLSHGDYE